MSHDLLWSDYDYSSIPFNEITSLGSINMINDDLFNVSWILGRYCNYACSYCWPHAHTNKKDHTPLEVCYNTIDEIKRQARGNGFNSFFFSLSGGEPTFHPHYLDILKYLANDIENTNYTAIHMTSNCSRKIKWFKEYVEIAKLFRRASITASMHREYLDTNEKMQEFADKLLLCQEHGVNTTINIVMVPEYFDELWHKAMFFHEQRLNVTIKPMRPPLGGTFVDYTEEMLQKIQNGMPQRNYNIDNNTQHFQIELTGRGGSKWYVDQAERLNTFGFNHFKNWYCNAGYQGIVIKKDKVHRSYGCKEQLLGTLQDGFELFKKPTLCVTENCVISTDTKIPKHRVMYK